MDEFSSDIFSSSVPLWFKLNTTINQPYNDLLVALLGHHNDEEVSIEASQSLEINSKNLKVKYQDSIYLLKKWNTSTNISSIENYIDTVKYLSKNGVKVAKPLKFYNNDLIYLQNNEKWTCNDFVLGDYFSGTQGQLIEAPLVIAHLSNQLSKLPKELYPTTHLDYDIKNYESTINKIKHFKKDWEDIFGNQLSEHIKKYWSEIQIVLEHLKQSNINKGKVVPMHCDLHPHNLIYEKDELKAIIDYDSIKLVPIGIALAFSSLKLCKQAMIYSNQQNPAEVGQKFKEKLIANLEKETLLSEDFYTLSLFEVLRRICLIFDLNLIKNKKWNSVLPIQLNHLIESKFLFNLQP